MDFESFAKLWPHQLDLLSGPLLEGDDDDGGGNMDNPINNELITVQNTHSFSESSTNSEFHDSLEADELKDEVCESLTPSKSAVHTFCVSAKNSCTSLKKTGLGMVVYVGRKHCICPDSDEEVDIETVDEELKRSPMRKAALSYRAFSREMLSVAEDKEILHEVPNVIFASDAEKETGLSSISSKNRNSETNCSAMAQTLGVLQDKEILHEVPNLISTNDLKSVTLGCKNTGESTTSMGTKYNAAVLQATDVDSLLEQFEASEGFTSQEFTKTSVSSLLEDNIMPVDEKAIHGNPGGKKDISSYIIQKIRMSSSVKKGPILIPPSHQLKSKTRNSFNQSGFETRKLCRSSSSQFPGNKECASNTSISSKYSFTLDHDHDYCTSSFSNIFCEKGEYMKSLGNTQGCEKDMNLETGSFLLDKCLSCEPDDFSENHCVKKKMSEEEYLIPDAEIEVEIADSHVDINESRPVKTSLAISHLQCIDNVCVDNLKASCSMETDKYISANIHRTSDKTEPVVPSVKLLKSTSPEKGLAAKSCVSSFDKLDTSGSVLLNEKLIKPNLRNIVNYNSISNCNSLKGKRKQDTILTDSLSVSSKKKSCSWLTSDIQNTSQRTLCIEKIDDALWRRTRSPCVDNNGRPFWKSEKQKQIEERRVVYVGKLPEGLKVNDLRECFTKFGPIQDISIHFRENGDNYGFVTFFNRSDAYEVVERGKLDPKLRRFDLCFGGRRQFCRTRYADLDSVDEGPFKRSLGETDFDTLLQKAKAGFQYVKHSSTTS